MKITTVDAITNRRDILDDATHDRATAIVNDVRREGEVAVRRWARELDGLADDAALVMERVVLEEAWSGLDAPTRALLERTAGRIRDFATRQRACLVDFEHEAAGVVAGHECVPVGRAGCYAPGGRYPLPSSVLMTVVTARAAGVREVIVASPRPQPLTMAAAFVAGADCLVQVGGAQAIAAMAYGAGSIHRCDVIVGPGNRYVTAAKHVVSRDVGIDMLAGPSELVVVADETADAEFVAADLLAQAEHDPDSLAVLLTTSREMAEAAQRAVARQLEDLPTADIARQAIDNGGVVICESASEVIALCDAIAPEHLALHVADAASMRTRFANFGAVFEGGGMAEVLGDYGVGPNHVLPTGGQARHTGGLSVFQFLRVRTRLAGTASAEVLDDVQRFAELEGLPGHARAALIRRSPS